MDKVKTFWAGYVDDKVYIDYEIDNYGEKRIPSLFTNKAEARKRFADARKVTIKEIKQ